MNYKLFLSGVLLALACFSLHAAESGCHCGCDTQSPFIYIAENTPIYNPGHIIAEQASATKNDKKANAVKAVKKEALAPAENKITEHEPAAVVLPAFPLAPSSSTFLQGGSAAATITPQQRTGGDSQSAKTNRENVYSEITKSDLSLYHPKQKQKLSPAATQCGMLTSFASASPPPPAP